jgi:eukaryotic-like serine/threonine-protein kinase
LAETLFNAGECVDAARSYARARKANSPKPDQTLLLKEANAWLAAGHVDEAQACIRPLLRELNIVPPRAQWLIPVITAKVLGLRIRGVSARHGGAITDTKKAFRADVCWSVGQGLSMFLSTQGAYFAIQSLIEALPLRDPQRIGRGLAFLGGACANAGGGLAAWGAECLSQAEALADEGGEPYLVGWCHVWRCNLELVSCRFERAVLLGDRAVLAMEQTPYSMSWECHTARCFALMARERLGDLHEVEERAQKIVEQASLRQDLYGSIVFALFIAVVAIARGDIARARAIANEVLTAWTRDNFTIQHFYALRVQAYCELYEGKPGPACERVISVWKIIQKSDLYGVPSARMDAWLLRGHIEIALAKRDRLRRRDCQRVVRQLTKQLAKQSKEAAAHSHLLNAALLVVAGRPSAAAVATDLAASAFDALGMKLWAAAARRVQHMIRAPLVANANDDTLRALGVREPERWLNSFGPWTAVWPWRG